MNDFVHLHVHSEFSLLDGLCKIPQLVAQAKNLNQKAIALTDHGNMYGAMHFYNQCREADIKPIIGLEAYVAKNSRFDKQVKPGSDQFHLTLLAQNHEGYKNLMKLTSAAHLEGFSYKPRIDDEILAQYSSNLIATSGCMGSRFNKLLMAGKRAEAEELFAKYKQIFPGRFYVEIQVHPTIDELQKLTTLQIEIARKLELPLVAANDVHYIHADEVEAQDALLCVQTRKLISDKKRMSMVSTPDLYLKSTAEMIDDFHHLPEAIKNTLVIAEQCDIKIPQGKLIFPNFPIPTGETDVSFLRQLTIQGLEKKFTQVTKTHLDRIDYELGVIKDKGYSTYFLITHDFVSWAKSQEIAVGPGRGSAAGSLVSYALDITTIDPIKHSLPFERFLNPERPTPPDIDLDFADERRDEVIDYVSQKYGHDHVAHVITFGRMEARVAIRDIGRVLGMPYEEPDKIAKLIPNDPGKRTTLDQALSTIPELSEYYKQPRFKKLINLAKKVEGNVRHHSVHAAAIIIADKPLNEYTPVQRDSKTGKTITQYDMYVLDANVADDAIGLLKFDFLGLRNLSIIQRALQLIKEHKNIKIKIDEIPLDDQKTFQLLSSGQTVGVFQLESAGMRRVAKSLKPNQFSDIAALVALYRPGPMDLIPNFIEGKHNPEKIIYPDIALKPILEETYGVMVYQEQVMQIFSTMGDYTLGEADLIRRAIGKKKKKILDENKKRFVQAAVKKGYQKKIADQVWTFIEAWANYGFNKAHAASYAMIAYQTAYLKANYPVEYMAALMSVESNSHSANRDEKVARAIETCKSMDIKVKAPDINFSDRDFNIEPDPSSPHGLEIRFGLGAIKNIGSAATENILETRKEHHKFNSFTQFLIQTDARKVNKKVLESLIKVGAFDAFAHRATLLEKLEEIRQRSTQFQSDIQGQESLFAGVQKNATQIQDNFAEIEEYSQQELLSFEKELLGIYLTDHPLAKSLGLVSHRANQKVADLDATLHVGKTFLFGGAITKLKEVTVRSSGKRMAFATFEDQSGSIEVLIFPRLYQSLQTDLKANTVVLLKAKIDNKDDELKLIAEKITIPDESLMAQVPPDLKHELFIPRKTSKQTLAELGKLLKSQPGEHRVMILVPNGGEAKKMLLPYGVEWSKKLEKDINQLLES